MSIKDKMYEKIVRGNSNVQYEYEKYVIENIDEHNKSRFKHWYVLLKLIWHYEVKKETSYLYYQKSVKSSTSQNVHTEIQNIERKDSIKRNKEIKNDSKNSIELRSTKQNNRNLVLNSAESIATPRVKPFIWVKGLFNYEIISFDIFDTLILRRTSEPRDVFTLLGAEFQIVDFSRIRFEAEKEAREISLALYGNREVNIYDIYKKVNEKTGLDISYGVEKEFEFELKVCFSNPYMKCMYDILKSQNKRIYIVSDMYWPKEYLVRLLNENGYEGFVDVLVSCDYKGGKRNGVLFEQLLEIEKDKKIVHIGDNVEADINGAKSYGIDTRYYANVQTSGNMYRENGMSPLVRSAYRGIVNSTLHNGTKQYSEQYEYGFVYGGLFVLGYVNWIHKLAIEKGIEKIVFLARDGYIYKRIYDKLYTDIPSEYALWSRAASLKYACNYTREDFLKRNIDHRINKKWKISSMLCANSLDELVQFLSQYNLSPDELIHEGNKKILENFFDANWDKVLDIQKKGQDYAKQYYESIIKDSSSILLVDTGWRGDNQLALRRLIMDEWKTKCKVYCCMAATIASDRNIVNIADDVMFCYMFSSCHNRMLYDSFNKNNVINMAIFELFSQSPCPSFDGFGENGEFIFGYAEVENYEIISEIIQGIEDFCNKYIEWFGYNKFMLNISGYDAYLPFRKLTRQYRPVKNAVGQVRFQQVVGIDKSKQVTKTLLELMRENGI